MKTEHEMEAARSAAAARHALAEKIGRLALDAETEEDARVVLLLAEAYANLASEPPRVRVP